MAVQWDKENGLNGWGVEFWKTIRGVKKDLPEVNKEIKQFIGSQNDLKRKNPEALEWIRSQLVQDAEELSNVTDDFKDDFANNTSRFASFTKKASNILKSFGASLASMGVNMAIGVVLEGAMTLIDNYADSVEHTKEVAESFASSIKSQQEEFTSNTARVDKLISEYDRLSKGVSDLGENVSLTSEEYDSYKNIVSELSDIMPNLTTIFDSQGDKIGFVKGKLEDANKEYEKYKQNQANKILYEGNEDGKTLSNIVDDYNN